MEPFNKHALFINPSLLWTLILRDDMEKNFSPFGLELHWGNVNETGYEI